MFDARQLDILQRCPRRFLLESRLRVLRWTPRALFVSCMRQAIFELSAGADVEAVRKEARTRFLMTAREPGLDILHGDPYTVAHDWCAMMDTILTALSRLVLLVLHERAPIELAPGLAWRFTSPVDDSGTFHRWVFADALDDDRRSAEFHAWQTFADMALAPAPLVLHVVEIGTSRKDRRVSPWLRAYRHEMFPSRIRFRHRNGTPMKGEGWKAVYLPDMPEMTPAAWVDAMQADGVTSGLIHHLPLREPTAEQAAAARAQIIAEAERARALTLASATQDAFALPMSRASCDGFVPCPWQTACYSPTGRSTDSELEQTGLYQLRAGACATAQR